MGNRIEIGNLRIDEDLYALVRDEIAPGTGIEARCLLESVRRHRCGVRTRKQVTLGETGYAPTADRRMASGAQK